MYSRSSRSAACLREYSAAASRVLPAHFPGEGGPVDPLAAAEDQRLLQEILQFPDISRPGVSLQYRQRVGGERRRRPPFTGGDPLQKMLRQQGDILPALA